MNLLLVAIALLPVYIPPIGSFWYQWDWKDDLERHGYFAQICSTPSLVEHGVYGKFIIDEKQYNAVPRGTLVCLYSAWSGADRKDNFMYAELEVLGLDPTYPPAYKMYLYRGWWCNKVISMNDWWTNLYEWYHLGLPKNICTRKAIS